MMRCGVHSQSRPINVPVSSLLEEHRCWWKPQLSLLPPDNVIVQPENCGTGVGDPVATAAHSRPRCPRAYRDNALGSSYTGGGLSRPLAARRGSSRYGHTRGGPFSLASHLRSQIRSSDTSFRKLRTMKPHSRFCSSRRSPPGPMPSSTSSVVRCGTPSSSPPHRCPVGLYQRRVPELVTEMQRAIRRDREAAGAGHAVTELYARLGSVDFSRDILPGQESSIRVVGRPAMRVSDLGTPERVARTLLHMPTDRMLTGTWTRNLDAQVSPFSLAEQHARQATAHATISA